MEYEFDVVAEMDMQGVLSVTKTRIPKLMGKVIRTPASARRRAEDGCWKASRCWAKDGGGQRSARLRELRGGGTPVGRIRAGASLEPARTLERLSDATL